VSASASAPVAGPFLRPEHVAPIRSLGLRAKLIVEGMIAGLHRSPYHGFSAEFLEYRPYRAGESTRMIDWRKYARTDKTVVRLFEDETNLAARILLDISASMRFSSVGAMNKYEYARTLAASLAWILIRQRDAVGLAAFDDTIKAVIPPRSANAQLKAILSTLERLAPAGATSCGAAIDTVARAIGKRGLCILISDLLDDPAAIIAGLRHLRFKRQDVMVIRILDPLEQTFRHDASLRITDMENNAEIVLDGATATEFYERGFDGHRRTLQAAMREMAIDCEVVTTDEPFVKALLRILEKRSRLG
jgi:uncharacterized protein (DUF58 family)